MSESTEKPGVGNVTTNSLASRTSKKKVSQNGKPSVRPTKEIKSKGTNKEIIRKKQLQIVTASTKLFAKKGYHSTSMREISQESGINLAYLYNFVSAKDDILYLFYKHLNEQVAPVYEGLFEANKKDPINQLTQFLKDMVKIVVDHKIEIRTAYTEIRHLEGEFLNAVLEAESELVRCVEQVIVRGQKQGAFNVPDTHFAANAIVFLLILYPMRGWNFDEHFTVNRHIKLMTTFILRLLGVDSSQPKREVKVKQSGDETSP